METTPSYSVYEITSPSGKSYIGITQQLPQTRFNQHVGRARTGKDHPFYCALRKYDPQQFQLVVLRSGLSRTEAQDQEIAFITARKTQGISYNVSFGGELNAAAGAARRQALMADPDWYKQYHERLLQGIANSSAHQKWHTGGLQRKAREWQRNNVRERYRIAYRAQRIANPGVDRTSPKTQYGRLYIDSDKVRRKRQSYMYRRTTTERWQATPEERKKEISRKISESLKKRNRQLTDEEKAERDAQLAKARSNIDHEYRKERQREAVDQYWTPERRAAKAEQQRKRRAAQKAAQ